MKDYVHQSNRHYVRLSEKGGKQREIPIIRAPMEYLDAYIEAAGIKEQKDTPLFRSAIGRSKKLSDRPLDRERVFAMIRRRLDDAGIEGDYSCHSFRATGITNYLGNKGTLESAQWIAGHADSRTTKLYDRRNQRATIEEMEKVSY